MKRHALKKRPVEKTRRVASPFTAAIYRVVRRIPRGKVATYGQVAEMAGRPGAARAVGRALGSLPGPLVATVPWQRVVNAAGKISYRDDEWPRRQRELLEREGVRFRRGGGVDLRLCGLPQPLRGRLGPRTSRREEPRGKGTARPGR